MRRRPGGRPSGGGWACVKRHPRPRRDDADARVELEALAALPLAQRQVGDLVPVGDEPLGEVAIPALGAPDRVGNRQS